MRITRHLFLKVRLIRTLCKTSHMFTRIGLDFILRHPGGVDFTVTECFCLEYMLKSQVLHTASLWKEQSVCFSLSYDEKRSDIKFLLY